MLDIRLIREEPDSVRANLARRNHAPSLELFDKVVAEDKEWRVAQKRVDDLRASKNKSASAIGELMRAKKKDEAESARKDATKLGAELETEEARLSAWQAELNKKLMRLPNLLHESVPIGKDDTENKVERTWGEAKKPAFELRAHGELMEAAGLADFDRAAKTSGAGFVFLKGELAQLDFALQLYALDFLRKKDWTIIEVPLMIRRAIYEGVTDLSDFESVMYKIENKDAGVEPGDALYLIATSEHAIGAMHYDEILEESAMPLKYAGISPCFRREIGARGVDTRGLFRMHQFNKIEQFIYCRPEDSWKYHEELLANSEALFQGLGIPYRVVNVCTGDIGTVAAKKYDIEAWSPRQGKYVEVVSCSNCTDYQARRLNLRIGRVGMEKRVPHTLNSTAIATSRAMVAILENYQNADGTVMVPEALRQYMAGAELIGKPA